MEASRQQRVLRQHLETDRLLGVEAVPVGEPPARPMPPTAERLSAAPSPPNTHAATPPAAGAAPRASIEVGDKLAVLSELDRCEVQTCSRCELHRSRAQTVFGEGDPDAALMIVGEGPGAQEDRTGRPFVGPAGELLDKQIGAMGFQRQQVYITNAVKCRPPNNRTPTPAEAATCGDYLRRQVEIVQPRVILAVGGPAAKLLLNTDVGITRLRGQWGRYDAVDPPIPVMPTFHPAYLLRAYTKDNRAKVWSDLQAVMHHLG